MSNRLALVSLNALPKMGPASLKKLLEIWPDPKEIVNRLKKRSINLDTVSHIASPTVFSMWFDSINRYSLSDFRSTLEKNNISILIPDDILWPFKDELYPPCLLYAKGDIELLEKPGLAVVGTRRCTSQGRKIAYEFSAKISQCDIAIISGLALGIDAAAHTGASSVAGSMIAVVGTGIDYIYPKKNHRLWNEVCESGLMLSESPLGAKPDKWRFPARNRIIASLCAGVLVVESHEKGGSLITANECVERDKTVMVVPGSIYNSACHGSNNLLLDCAVPALEPEDVIAQIFGLSTNQLPLFNSDLLDSLSIQVFDEIASGEQMVEKISSDLKITNKQIFECLHKLEIQDKIFWDGLRVYVK